VASVAVAFCAVVLAIATAGWPQSPTLSITLTGQSMIRSDIRTTAPAAVPTIKSLLKGDVIFTNFEGTVALPGQPNDSTPLQGQGAGFLAPPEALDALPSFGFNLVSLSNNHAWNLRAIGIQNAIAEADKLGLVHAGTGRTLSDALAPGYLKTPKGTIALIGMASGEVAPGGSATPTRAGVPCQFRFAQRNHLLVGDANKSDSGCYQHDHNLIPPDAV